MKKKLFIVMALISCITSYAYEIHPKPQIIENRNSSISITDVINLIIENGTSTKSVERIKEVLEKHGIIYSESGQTDNSKTNILIGQYTGGIIADYATENGISLQVFNAGENKFDEHILDINNNSSNGDIVIIGNGKGSEYYAMATLDQILEQQEKNTLNTLTIYDYAYTQYRGIVEGFYGFPYTVETRIELLEFCKRYKMNSYVYGPKADPYHLGFWREEYPKTITDEQRYKGYITQDDIKNISEKATSCNVKFTWAIHPALENGISFTSETTIDQGVQDIMTKFKHMHDLGVRSFGVFIDDMSGHPKGNLQARLADQTQKKLREEFGTSEQEGVGELFFVPTAYSLDVDNYNSVMSYLKDIDKDVVVVFTGYGVWSNINKNDFDTAKNRIGRNATLWWNNPVNDNIDAKLFMRKLTTHYTIDTKEPIPTMGGLLINPMNQGCASKPALFSSAEYAWNPAAFDEDKSWEDFFSTEINDIEMAEALKTFALNSDTDVEEQNLIDLYNTFKSEYQKGELPSNAATLHDEMQKIYDACVTLEGMENHQNKSYQMLYEEIRYWISKLKLMSLIIKDGIDFMTDNNIDNWIKYTTVKDTKANLNINPNVILTSLEGSGTKTTLQKYEATVGLKNMLPFVNFIAEKIDDYTLTLKDYGTEPYFITNMESIPENVSLKTEKGSIKIEGLEGIKLDKDEFIGVNFCSINEFSAESNTVQENLNIEYSINGKTWFRNDNSDENIQVAYIRINNASSTEQEIDTNVLTYNLIVGSSLEKPTVTTNMSVWENYKIDNVIDGSKDTKFWSSTGQAQGQYILLDYGKIEPKGEITITFCTNDKPSGTIIIQTSEDNTKWVDVTEFTKSDINSNNEFVCNANNVPARYIRLYIKSASGPDWFQVAEISCEGVKQVFQAVNETGEYVPCLSDKKLSSIYVPEKEGHIIYNMIEYINVDTVAVYHCYEFDDNPNAPSVSVYAGEEWKNIGHLTSTISKFTVSDIKDIEKIKVEWNNENIPSLVEIYPIGKPYNYKENENEETGINNYSSGDINIRVIDNHVTITGTESKAAIYNIDGRCIYSGDDREITIQAPGIYILNIEKYSQYIYIK